MYVKSIAVNNQLMLLFKSILRLFVDPYETSHNANKAVMHRMIRILRFRYPLHEGLVCHRLGQDEANITQQGC